MIKIRSYKISDIENFVEREKDKFPGGILGTIEGVAANSITWSILHNDTVVAFLGVQILWVGVAQVWAITSDEARGHGLGLAKAAKQGLAWVKESYDIRRFNTTMKDDDENLKWIKMLGFEREYTMKHAAPEGGHLYGYVKFEGSVNRPLQGG